MTKAATNGSLTAIYPTPTVSATTTGTYYSAGVYSSPSMTVSGGVTNAGYLAAVNGDAIRTGSSDTGTLASLMGSRWQYGHYDSFSRQTNTAYGLYVLPYFAGGTITNAFDLLLQQPAITGGTVTNHWGLYQADTTARNYFAGSVGIGTTSAVTTLQVANGAIMAGSMAGAPNQVGAVMGAGAAAQVGVFRRDLATYPATPAAGDAFVLYASDNTKARLWTPTKGDLMTVDTNGAVTAANLNTAPVYSTQPASRCSPVTGWNYCGESLTITVPAGQSRYYRMHAEQMVMAPVGSNMNYIFCPALDTNTTTPTCVYAAPYGVTFANSWNTTSVDRIIALSPGTYTWYMMVQVSASGGSVADSAGDGHLYSVWYMQPL